MKVKLTCDKYKGLEIKLKLPVKHLPMLSTAFSSDMKLEKLHKLASLNRLTTQTF